MVDTSVRYLSTQQVSEYLNVDRHTVVNLVNRRKLNAVRVGTSIRIHPDDLEAYIAKNSTRRA